MTEQELIQGYETEIHYQKHMIENLGRWFSLFFTIASILSVIGILAMLVFGYGIYKGRLNLQKVIDDFEAKIQIKY